MLPTPAFGALQYGKYNESVFKSIKALAIVALTPQAIWTPSAGKSFVLLGGMISLSVAGSIIFEDASGAANEIFRTSLMAAGIGIALPHFMVGYKSNALNNALFIDVTASGSVSGFVFGIEE